MAFFEDETVPPEISTLTLPEWVQPGAHRVGVSLPQTAVVFNDGKTACVVRKFVAHPTGLEFSIEIRHCREFKQERFRDVWSGGGFRYGVLLADGTQVLLNRVNSWPPSRPEGASYTLVQTDGGGSDSIFRIGLWLTPLPPDGELTVVVEWKPEGFDETRTTIDLGALRETATHSIELFPDDRVFD